MLLAPSLKSLVWKSQSPYTPPPSLPGATCFRPILRGGHGRGRGGVRWWRVGAWHLHHWGRVPKEEQRGRDINMSVIIITEKRHLAWTRQIWRKMNSLCRSQTLQAMKNCTKFKWGQSLILDGGRGGKVPKLLWVVREARNNANKMKQGVSIRLWSDFTYLLI